VTWTKHGNREALVGSSVLKDDKAADGSPKSSRLHGDG
jgi:hypothetical protein